MKKKYSFKGAKRGAVAKLDAKVMRTIRLDLDVLSWLVQESERTRIPYQTLINSMLKQEMDRRRVLGKAEALSVLELSELVKKLGQTYGIEIPHSSSNDLKDGTG